MDWKETVMRTYKFRLDGVVSEVPVKEIKIDLPGFAERQAEISYKAGVQKVVEWIKGVNKSGDFYYSFDQAELEAKLEEWGIKNAD